ncbi:hypothetical protein N7533_011216 [Penicillium manginii]|uniref:uncharacterized protein n=1 Tax=Penicillium manginii TaxID=203109 RepID=UPI002547F3A4|nr:uncharacterized protein N7533_011216 [Penicillium manginii]KAJ5741807.1 hypothetical protein N7533_011216 [Penicillium manginii]
MGFLGIIPASKLAAFYDPKTQQLTLSAEGTVEEYTGNFRFRQVPWMGGFKFYLEAWTGPLTSHTQHYAFDQSFKLSMVPFPKDVIVVDANNPNGVPVEIHFGGHNDPASKPTSAAPSSSDGKAVQELPAPPQDTINVLYKWPFEVQHAAEVPKMGFINIDFDKRFLEIESASINNGQIVWKFNSLETGDTQIIISVNGGTAQYTYRIVKDVRIFVLPEILEPGPVITQDKCEAEAESAILSFLGRVNIARRKVLQHYPDAVLYNVEASTTERQGVTSPKALGHMRVMFRVEKGTVTINSTGYGSFGAAEFKSGSILGNANIDWPVGMDADEADQILKKEGFKGPYTALNLMKPLYPGFTDDLYGFRMVDGIDKWVNTKTKKLITE